MSHLNPGGQPPPSLGPFPTTDPEMTIIHAFSSTSEPSIISFVERFLRRPPIPVVRLMGTRDIEDGKETITDFDIHAVLGEELRESYEESEEHFEDALSKSGVEVKMLLGEESDDLLSLVPGLPFSDIRWACEAFFNEPAKHKSLTITKSIPDSKLDKSILVKKLNSLMQSCYDGRTSISFPIINSRVRVVLHDKRRQHFGSVLRNNRPFMPRWFGRHNDEPQEPPVEYAIRCTAWDDVAKHTGRANDGGGEERWYREWAPALRGAIRGRRIHEEVRRDQDYVDDGEVSAWRSSVRVDHHFTDEVWRGTPALGWGLDEISIDGVASGVDPELERLGAVRGRLVMGGNESEMTLRAEEGGDLPPYRADARDDA